MIQQGVQQSATLDLAHRRTKKLSEPSLVDILTNCRELRSRGVEGLSSREDHRCCHPRPASRKATLHFDKDFAEDVADLDLLARRVGF
jgi:hypothetical protein